MTEIKTRVVKYTQGDTRKTLAILTLFVLLASSFTFSSCKNCAKSQNKPVERLQSGDKNATALDDFALFKVKEHLLAHNASDGEVEVMKKIGRENFGKEIGRIVFEFNHFTYRDSTGVHEGQSGNVNCALYAMKRYLFVLGREGYC
jgi:hypothetical protein